MSRQVPKKSSNRWQKIGLIIGHTNTDRENQTVEIYTYAVVPSALDHASKSSHNELPADIPLPVWDSLQQTNKE